MSGRVRFTEEMRGYVLAGAPAHDTGYHNGRAAHSPLLFHLTIGSTDVDAFLTDPHHLATAAGWIDAPALGAGHLPVEAGWFNLFTAARPGRYAMEYRLWFQDGSGADRTLLGVKDVGNDPGFDLWADTTTLAVDIVEGHVGEGDDGVVLGRGQLRIEPAMFARQLTTFRGDVGGVARFAAFFAGKLIREYASRAGGRAATQGAIAR